MGDVGTVDSEAVSFVGVALSEQAWSLEVEPSIAEELPEEVDAGMSAERGREKVGANGRDK